MGGDEPTTSRVYMNRAVVFPAWAGMNRLYAQGRSEPGSVPRVGGDEPPQNDDRRMYLECSPRGRG